jgi:arabinogalactan oligomer/maltooligosaccharide transport system substrate-binding protein
MVRKKKILSLIMTTALLMGTLAGCGGAKETAGTTASPAGDKKITIWSHMNPQEFPELQALADKWGKEKGVTVETIDDKAKIQEYIQAASSSKAPDLYMFVGNDNLGTFQKAGLLAEVPSGFLDESKYTSKALLDAVTIGGKQYAVPFAQETVSLFVNKDKVKQVPKTMEELVTMAKDPAVGFEYNGTAVYYNMGILTGQGGYIFKNNNGTTDPKDIGLGNEGAVKGLQFIQDLFVKDKLMAADITEDIAKGDFLAGKTGFYISGAWDVAACKEAGLNFEVVPLPTLGGKPITTALGVQASFVAEKSPNKDLAWDLMKYLTENIDPVIIEKGGRIPATKAGTALDSFKTSKEMVAFSEQAKVAVPMPNIPEMQAIWTPAGDVLKSLAEGKVDAKTAGDQMTQAIKEGIAQMK